MRPFRDWNWGALRAIPLFGGLVDCRWQNHWESIRQILVILITSTTPIWLAALVIYAIENQGSTHFAFSAAIHRTVDKGQLFMYCTSLLAPLFWIALVDPKGARIFPSRVPHMILVGAIDMVAATFFGLTVAGNPLNQDFILQLSLYMLSASILLRYLGMVYHASRMPNAPDEFRKQEDEFSHALREHRQ